MGFPPIRLQQAWNFGGLSVREPAMRTWKRTNDHELMTRAAAVAFYAMLALVPFLALVITLAIQALPDLRRGEEGVGDLTVQEFRQMLRAAVPAEAYSIVEEQIARIQEQGAPIGFLAFGLLVTIWLASSLFVAVIDAMNAVYGVKETRPFWKLRLTAIVMTVIQAVILIAALVSIVAWPVIMKWLGLGGLAAVLAAGVNWMILFVMLLLSFALTFYVRQTSISAGSGSRRAACWGRSCSSSPAMASGSTSRISGTTRSRTARSAA